jgi:hypothetical protein
MPSKIYEVYLDDISGTGSIEVEATSGLRAAFKAASDYAIKSLEEGFELTGFEITFDYDPSRDSVSLVYIDLEGNDGRSEPLTFYSDNDE